MAELFCEDYEKMMPVNETERILLENWIKLEEKQKKVILMQMDVFLNS